MVFDIVLLIPIAWFTIKGFCKGFIIELSTLVALILGVYLAYAFSGFTENLLLNTFGFGSKYIQPISFVLTFIMVVIAVFILARILESFIKTINLGFLNKLAGGVFGFFKITLILGLILFQISFFDHQEKLITQEVKAGSFTYKPLVVVGTTTIPLIKNIKQKVLDYIPGTNKQTDE